MTPAHRATAAALLAAGLLAGGAATATAAPAPAAAERITTADQLQRHLAQAIALERLNCGAVVAGDPMGRPANV
ncbi:hypothetical protein [Streptomyces sp. AK02-01A]|uniref:hypothetical protein n=1 Tax=Streptomyces sp. AK02-01A TaxID=3028648 RepID=UPI0029BAAE64|nr:hypothetical protein [Streptomyces sp. AK02-01A]MDX3852323.1 hypothetical protein [Streptomyces sp. AK02-01A]